MFVYVLKSLKDGKFYIGCTENIEKRLVRHNSGMVISTRYRRPFKVIYTESMQDLKAARKREIEIKKMKGGIQFKQLIAGLVHR